MKRRTVLGIIFLLAGLWKLANMWGIIENDWLWSQPWTEYIAPALLVYVGAKLIVNSYRRDPDQWLQRPIPEAEDGKRISCAVSFGGDQYVFRGEKFSGARLDAFCGGIRLDLRDAKISADEEIDIHTFMGGIELLVPPTVNILVKSRSFIGGVGNETVQTPNENAPYIHVIASNMFGGVSIRN